MEEKKPYRVNDGANGFWFVIGPDGARHSLYHDDDAEAQFTCKFMNDAYQKGRESVAKEGQ